MARSHWRETLSRSARAFAADRLSMVAGSLAYHWFLALFPALIATLGLASLIHTGAGTVGRLVASMDKALPLGASSVVGDALRSSTSHAGKGSLAVVVSGLALAMWSASSGMTSLQTGLDVASDLARDRPLIARRLIAFVMMGATVILGGIAAALVVFGASVGTEIEHHVPFAGTAFVVVWTVLRWAAAIMVISLLFNVYYYFGPNREKHREKPKWRWVTPGGVVGTAIFLLASLGFSVYVSRFGHYDRTYGVFAGVAILIFWLYLAGIAVLLGAEINAEAGQPGRRGGLPDARPRRGRLSLCTAHRC